MLEKTLASHLDSKEINPVNLRKSVLNIHWKYWCCSWNSNTLATWCKELSHWKRLWCWERLRAGGEEEDRGWDDWMASLTQWTRVWVDSGSWWWTGRPRMLQVMGSQRVRHDWATELNWWDQMPWSLFSECWALSRVFHSPLSLSSRGSLVLRFLPLGWCNLHIWGYWYFSQQFWFQLVLQPAQCFWWIQCGWILQRGL